MRFSERHGLKPIKDSFQIDSMDENLRNGLWNVVSMRFFSNVKVTFGMLSDEAIGQLVTLLWKDFFKKPVDTIPKLWNETYNSIRSYFFNTSWNDVYDFIEFIISDYSADTTFINRCNQIMEREMSAYRIVKHIIVRITSAQEIDAIEKASNTTSPINIHINSALKLLSDRKNPDFRNSIKESISAVEATCKIIAKDPKATLKQALNTIEKKVKLHSALKNSFVSLYAYTSDDQGIRHALMDEPNLNHDDAKFMLVSCAAFINYLISRNK